MTRETMRRDNYERVMPGETMSTDNDQRANDQREQRQGLERVMTREMMK